MFDIIHDRGLLKVGQRQYRILLDPRVDNVFLESTISDIPEPSFLQVAIDKSKKTEANIPLCSKDIFEKREFTSFSDHGAGEISSAIRAPLNLAIVFRVPS